jgi:RNA polymerase subunit RPABC4/transcription elongation factor Spt4
MAYDPALKTRVLGVLETSDDPDAPTTAQLLRDMETTICQLARVLSCPSSLSEGKSEACAFYWNGQQCACERCGQLANAWALTAGSVLNAGFGKLTLAAPGSPTLPGNRPLTTEQIRGAFRHLGDAVTELAPVLSMASGTAAASAPTRICGGCGKPVSQSARFCPACGRTALGQEFCMNCNSTVDPETNFCPKCGAKVA